MIFGVDVDLTIVDTLILLIQFVRNKLPDEGKIELNRAIENFINNNDIYTNFHDLLNFYLKKYNINQTADDFWSQQNLYDNLYPYKEAEEVIKWLHYKVGFKIVFITTVYPQHYQSKMNFIFKFFPYTYDFVTLDKKYLLGCLDYFVDDNIKHIEEFKLLGDPRIQTFLYRTIFNVNNKKYKTYTWFDIHDWFIQNGYLLKGRYYNISGGNYD